MGFLLLLVILPWQAALAETTHYPDDVQRFLDNVDECQYYAGEWDSSLPKARQREIEREVKKYCELAKEQQKVLQKKYKGNQIIESVMGEMVF